VVFHCCFLKVPRSEIIRKRPANRSISQHRGIHLLRGPGNGLGDIYQVDLAQIMSR
jgi:hypothetical protein